ncbi:3-hydroxyanthranilate 3,4-dioxygenase [Enemella dayhoffiae]|uniref:3-hydroxyanthranilate 3,4-dioxygenase n=1 Tax=Enemella dayhoffiae TaxID=2016507 RepID=A0A255H2P2_9ACTN|nr:3-hydroxyanthranilate 3,4-dioxygenase [Enemella dayhoffiae]OYO22068.1 3-hydroxyanthranilate 3,4-dioxygenase [Enemella dayhoffiae]
MTGLVINLQAWLTEHADQLRPPVNNKVIFPAGKDFIVQVVGGPNQRTDFHVEPYEELFHQIRGSMHVNIQTEQGMQRIDINEGDLWLLPGGVPHSPQRPEPGSIGIVVERIRAEGVLESFRWYCLRCNHQLHEVTWQVRDIVADLPPAFEGFYADEALRSCAECGAVHPGKG